jgi:hypothetical protein
MREIDFSTDPLVAGHIAKRFGIWRDAGCPELALLDVLTTGAHALRLNSAVQSRHGCSTAVLVDYNLGVHLGVIVEIAGDEKELRRVIRKRLAGFSEHHHYDRSTADRALWLT